MKRMTALGIILLCAMLIVVASGQGVSKAQSTAKLELLATATPAACTNMLPGIETNLAVGCNALNTEQVCYGNPALTVDYGKVPAPTPFVQPGSLIPVSVIKSLTRAPLNAAHTQWGVALLRTQPDTPDTNLEQAVTFILYGNAQITDILTLPRQGPPPVRW